jgi:predicted metalloprotease with PDZ domain
MLHRRFASALALVSLLCISTPGFAADRYYDASFLATIRPNQPTVKVELRLAGERLPSQLEFHIDPARHRAFISRDPVTTEGKVVTWKPTGKDARLSYEFVINHERSPKRFDSLLTNQWAVLRGDKLVPRLSVTSRKSLKGRTTLQFALPPQWSVAAPYPQEGPVFKIEDPDRRLDRPSGWIIAGKLGKRSEIIEGIQTIVAAPEGESSRRQDILAFLNWNLPHVKKVFPDMPKRLLIVSAGDPMWRGGLSAPNSLFLHADRPLISENRTSTLLHELVHVAMGIRGDEESDWIVEGFAEYYSLEILRRSGGIGRQRYDAALKRMTEWAKRSPSVFTRESSGASTARAAIALRAADIEIKQASNGRASLDDVAAKLAKRGGEVTLALLQSVGRETAGKEVQALSRSRLMTPP